MLQLRVKIKHQYLNLIVTSRANTLTEKKKEVVDKTRFPDSSTSELDDQLISLFILTFTYYLSLILRYCNSVNGRTE